MKTIKTSTLALFAASAMLAACNIDSERNAENTEESSATSKLDREDPDKFVYREGRLIEMQGAENFRDMGGYVTPDGKAVRWGKVYRSAALNNLTDQDLEEFVNLSIETVCDFRGPHELAESPSRLPEGVQTVWLPAGSRDTSGWQKMFAKIAEGDVEPNQVLTSYYAAIDSLPHRYGPFFEALIEKPDDRALLFHCSAGKDKTGIGAALFLKALGVDDEQIMADYLASNTYRKADNEKLIAYMDSAYGLPKAYAEAIAGVEPAYLEATFSAMKNQYGSVERFMEKELGLDAEKINVLRKRYLEDTI